MPEQFAMPQSEPNYTLRGRMLVEVKQAVQGAAPSNGFES
jgi:hypothetical protein